MTSRSGLSLLTMVVGSIVLTGCEPEPQADEESRSRIEEMSRTGIEPVREVEDMQRELAEREGE